MWKSLSNHGKGPDPMKRRDLSLEKYNISKYRYRELYNFCLQYDERRRQIEELQHQSPSPSDGMPKGSGISNPTALVGTRIATLSAENKIIEQSAREASPELCYWLLEAAKYDLKFDFLHLREGMPCGKNEFQKLRRKFYYILDQKKRNL